MSRGPACSSVATRSTTIAPSPSTCAPTIRAKSARVIDVLPRLRLSPLRCSPRGRCSRPGAALRRSYRRTRAMTPSWRARCARPERTLLVRQRLDHLVGDVDALAGVNDGVLQDQVELLGGGDLLDHLVRAFLDAGELLVAAQIEILAELALHPLQVARLVREIALLVAPLGIGHRRAVLVEQRLHVTHLFRELLDLRIASREFLFYLRLCALCGRRLAEQPLGVDEADLVLGGRCRAGGENERDGEACLQQAR